MNEFKPHDYFNADDQGYISRKVFIEHVRNTYDHMRELATLIKGYDETIDTYLERWDQNLESLDDSIIGLLHEWIDDSTFATVINEEIFKTKADQVDLENVTAQLQQTMTQTEFDSWVSTLLDGGPSIFFDTLTALKTAYPTGSTGVALVRETDPARLYVWNGTMWADYGAYQGVEVKDETLSLRKLDKPVRDTLRPANVALPLNYIAQNTTGNAEVPINVGIYKGFKCTPARWTFGDGVWTTTGVNSIGLYVYYYVTEEMRKWGRISFSINSKVIAGTQGSCTMEFFDAAGVYISSLYTEAEGDMLVFRNGVIPTNAATISVWYRINTTGDVVEVSQPCISYGAILEPYDETYYKKAFLSASEVKDNPLNGKSYLALGTSITAGGNNNWISYANLIAEANGMILDNYANGGATIRKRTDSTNNVLNRVEATLNTTADYITIEGLMNDAYVDIVNDPALLGTITTGYTATLDTGTFCGGLEQIFKTALDKWVGKKILFILTHNSAARNQVAQDTLHDLARKICEKWSIPYVDLYRGGGLNTSASALQKDTYTYPADGTHPNTLGYQLYYVPQITAKLKTL